MYSTHQDTLSALLKDALLVSSRLIPRHNALSGPRELPGIVTLPASPRLDPGEWTRGAVPWIVVVV